MIARQATVEDITFVCNKLRQHNRVEFAATHFPGADDAVALAGELLDMRAQGIEVQLACLAGAAPVALVGAWIVGPGLAVVRLVATDEWLSIARPAYRWLKRRFIPCVLAPNVRRAETRVLDCGAASRAWLHRLGFTEEGRARALGRNGEDFVHMAWINAGHRHV